jgi:signal transduction histidine kinase
MGMGHGMMHGANKYADLPENSAKIIGDVLEGKTVFSEGFSDVLSKSTLTVGVPIKNEKGDVWGAVLLHSPVYGIKSAVNKGAGILGVSILLALLVAIALSVILSYSFTKPLSKMKVAALSLSAGDYSAKSDVDRRDEIGELSEILNLLAMRLDEASKQSQKLEQMRRDFVANISHELRTPITVMRGSLEALYEKVVVEPKKVDEYYSQMLEEVKFLDRLVGDLLDLARLQAVDFSIEKENVNICDVLSDVKRSALKLAEKKGIMVEVDFTDPCLNISGDFGRLRQMFLAVIDNAIKFSPLGSPVNISIGKDIVSIRDRGPGIDPESLPYIFDRFSRTHDVLNKSGSGLGLAIAKQIAERHGIKLRAENHRDGGALFIFELF